MVASESRWQNLRSRLSERAHDIRTTLQERGATHFERLPHPIQQGCRLVWRTGRETADDRILGLSAEAALFTLISLPALLVAVVGSLGFVAAALGPQGTHELSELVLGIPGFFSPTRPMPPTSGQSTRCSRRPMAAWSRSASR